MNGNTAFQRAIRNNGNRPLDKIIAAIAKQAATGTCITPSADEWVEALPHLDDVACKWSPPATMTDSYIWYENGAYHATNLPYGLEEREGRPLNRYEAFAILDGISHQPVSIEEVPRDE